MIFDPAVFGEGFHAFVQQEYEVFGRLSIVFHIASYILLFAAFKLGNKIRRVFSIWFSINWAFLFAYWGVYGVIYWLDKGIVYLAVYGFAPVLLGLILYNWIREMINPRIDLNISKAESRRFAVLIILAWGLWYPSYIFGEGFRLRLGDLLFSCYGIMPCPTTMFVLSIMTLKYPSGNRPLYRLFTLYALFIGSATAASGWIPDIPFVILGLYALILIIAGRRKIAVA